MRIRTVWRLLVLAGIAGVAAIAAAGEPRAGRDDGDVLAVFERLEPGMTVGEVATIAGEARLRTTTAPVSSWLRWRPSPDGRGMLVLRAFFHEGRVLRLELEAFGEEYRRLVKGADPGVEIAADQLARIWRRSWRAERAAERCRDALDAYHDLLVGAQERLVPAEQQAWARALLLRRAAEGALPAASRLRP